MSRARRPAWPKNPGPRYDITRSWTHKAARRKSGLIIMKPRRVGIYSELHHRGWNDSWEQTRITRFTDKHGRLSARTVRYRHPKLGYTQTFRAIDARYSGRKRFYQGSLDVNIQRAWKNATSAELPFMGRGVLQVNWEGAVNIYRGDRIPRSMHVGPRSFLITRRHLALVGAGAAGLTAAGTAAYIHHKHHQQHKPPQLTHQQRVMIASKRRRVAGKFA